MEGDSFFTVFFLDSSELLGESAFINGCSCKRLPWYTKGLQKYKNLTNNYYKKYSKTHNPADGEIYWQHKRFLGILKDCKNTKTLRTTTTKNIPRHITQQMVKYIGSTNASLVY
ncbi:uncharacterized protein LOC127010712 isoform X40 [Drosophila biarmipes]|uniref:uncharacterized protein LOC127010712 isoform X22 n=1 Tax=Drosophila biarmipes TaxID=125945 RepID=UPI0021CCB98C|nr:uncharacterized protein LOC127010712 isoform X22 [Drosophila biarmipes]XP_050741208.1 uncharacterized protein LOC127010712 isoform X23 [Drosophila biarmipes]XP_050741209.1 uncharacterized protein LOC127010712 isoform X24 [Drosophila biarmipes]XP_050741210.1 uncharacterized protein LOC127010712 isoform X25 [Drosophila biarmipes]XP_050741211.1 uncharacterized protein LOC127010712 isoform X26 [Drosophila biarmipes]XP_050741212.1 uncharacterized protein LOC127010712 isoform X27 [Drosophila biar